MARVIRLIGCKTQQARNKSASGHFSKINPDQKHLHLDMNYKAVCILLVTLPTCANNYKSCKNMTYSWWINVEQEKKLL
jgi:hypothetical protein